MTGRSCSQPRTPATSSAQTRAPSWQPTRRWSFSALSARAKPPSAGRVPPQPSPASIHGGRKSRRFPARRRLGPARGQSHRAALAGGGDEGRANCGNAAFLTRRLTRRWLESFISSCMAFPNTVSKGCTRSSTCSEARAYGGAARLGSPARNRAVFSRWSSSATSRTQKPVG